MIANLSVEPKMIRTFWRDGLVDILLGLGLLLIGIAWQVDLVVLGAIAPALLIPLWQPIRNKFIEPKLGYVDFTQEREQKNQRFLIGMAIGGVFTLSLGVALYFFARQVAPTGIQWIAALPALLLAAPVFAIGVILKSARFFAYAGVFMLAGFTVAATQGRPGIGLLVPGIIILLWGVTLMVRFFKSVKQATEE